MCGSSVVDAFVVSYGSACCSAHLCRTGKLQVSCHSQALVIGPCGFHSRRVRHGISVWLTRRNNHSAVPFCIFCMSGAYVGWTVCIASWGSDLVCEQALCFRRGSINDGYEQCLHKAIADSLAIGNNFSITLTDRRLASDVYIANRLTGYKIP